MLCLGAAALVTAPLYAHRDGWGIFDWDQKLMEEGAARRAILEHGELLLWNPWVGGGKSAVGDPLARHLSPVHMPFVLLGELLGCRISITIHVAIGMAFSWALARALGIPPLPAAIAAIVGFANGSVAWHLSYGQLEWISAAWIPGCLLFAARAGRSGAPIAREILAGGGCLAMMLLEGGIYLLPPAVAAMGTVAAITSMLERRLRPACAAVAIACAAVLLAAIKLIPTAEMAHMHPRAFDGSRRAIGFYVRAGTAPGLVPQAWQLFLRRTSVADSIVYRTDASCFVGAFAILLAGAGIVLSPRRVLSLLLPCAAIVLIHLGPLLPVDPWRWLGTIGPLETLRFPERFIEVAAILLGVIAAEGLHVLTRTRPVVSLPAVLIALASFTAFDWPLYHRAFTRDTAPVVPRSFAQVGVPRHSTYHTFLERQGADRGYDVTPRYFYVHHEGEPEYRGEAFIRSGHGEARIAAMTSNTIVVDTDAPSGGLLVVNQNYDPGFAAVGGASRIIQSEGGLLAVAVRAGHSRVTFRYRPPGFAIGAMISAIALLGLGAVAVMERRAMPRPAGSSSPP